MAVLGALSGSMSMKMAMRQTTRFSVVSSIQDDSFGSKHLPSAIYALAKTARGETAACSHPRRSTFTVRALHGVRSRLTRELDLSLMVVEQFVADIENLCSQITKFTTTYAPTTPSVCDCLVGVAAAATTQRAGVATPLSLLHLLRRDRVDLVSPQPLALR